MHVLLSFCPNLLWSAQWNNRSAKTNHDGAHTQGTYRLTGDELEWSMSGITKNVRAKVTATELEVTDDENQTVRYKRM